MVCFFAFSLVACGDESDGDSSASQSTESVSQNEESSEAAESSEPVEDSSGLVEDKSESSVDSFEEDPIDANVLQFKNHLGETVINAGDVESATATYLSNEQGEPECVVVLVFTEEGAEKFAEATKEAAKSQTGIGIYVDGILISEPTVSSEYSETGITDGEAIISGEFETFDQADSFCDIINSAING